MNVHVEKLFPTSDTGVII